MNGGFRGRACVRGWMQVSGAAAAWLLLFALGLSFAAEAQELRTLDSLNFVESLAFSPDGRILVSGGLDRIIKFWDTASGQLLRILEGHTEAVDGVAFTRDGRLVASGGVDNTIRLWDAASGQPVRTLEVHTNGVLSLAFSPDGGTLVSGSWDHKVKLWDVASGKTLRTLQGHKDSVWSVAFSPDGRSIVSGSTDKTIKLWDAASGRLIRTLTGHKDAVSSVAISPDGRTIASGGSDRMIKLWDAATGCERQTLKGHASGVNAVAFSPDGRMLVSGAWKNVKIWDVASGRLLQTMIGHKDEVETVAFAPDGRSIASGGHDSTIRPWAVGGAPGVAVPEPPPVAAAPVVAAAAPPAPPDPEPPTVSVATPLPAPPAAEPAAPAAPAAEPPPAPAADAPPAAVAPVAPVTTPIVAAALPARPEPKTVDPAPPPVAQPAATAVPPAATAAPLGRRVALIVANGDYHDAPLANPLVDAGLVAESLKRTGFAVTVKTNVDLDAFEEAVTAFADSAKGADLALFYCAGHGFSVAAGGIQQNLLMATSANFHARTALALQGSGEPLDHIEETIVGHARATLIFVDACRSIPALASRGAGGRGFARLDTDAIDGAYVVLSTRQGKTADDGTGGQGSPFARAFAAVLPVPGLRIEDDFARIREKVRAATAGQQVPDVIRSDLPEGGVVLVGAGAP